MNFRHLGKRSCTRYLHLDNVSFRVLASLIFPLSSFYFFFLWFIFPCPFFFLLFFSSHLFFPLSLLVCFASFLLFFFFLSSSDSLPISFHFLWIRCELYISHFGHASIRNDSNLLYETSRMKESTKWMMSLLSRNHSSNLSTYLRQLSLRKMLARYIRNHARTKWRLLQTHLKKMRYKYKKNTIPTTNLIQMRDFFLTSFFVLSLLLSLLFMILSSFFLPFFLLSLFLSLFSLSFSDSFSFFFIGIGTKNVFFSFISFFSFFISFFFVVRTGVRGLLVKKSFN